MAPQRSLYDELLEQHPSSAPATEQPAKNVYDEIIADPNKYQQVRMRVAQDEAQKTTPDRRADVMRIAEAADLPVDVVDRDYDTLKQRFTVDKFPYLQTQRETPALAEWSTDPNHAALAKDDMENLGFVEWVLSAVPRAFAQQWNRENYSNLRYKSLFKPLTREEQDAMNSYKFNADLGGRLGEGDRWQRQIYTGAGRLLAQAFTPAKYAVVGGAETALIGGTYGSIVPGVGTLAGAGSGFTVGARAGAMYGVFKSANIQEAVSTYDELLQERDEMGKPMDPDVARMAALGVGAINGLIEQFGLEAFVSRFPGLKKLSGAYTREAMKDVLRQPTVRAALKKLAKGYIGGMTEEVATEVAQQVVTITGEELAKYAEGGFKQRTKSDVWDELVATAASAIPEFALGMAPGPVQDFAGDVHRAKVGEQTKLMVEALGQGIAASKTYERLPSAMRKFVEQATKDGPVKELYQPADTWTAYWQAKGQNPREVATEVTGDPNAYDAGLRSGLIVIPTSAYAQNLAGTEHNAFFANEVKLGPDMMNGRETEEFKARVEQLKEQVLKSAQAMDEKAPQDADAAQLREVEDAAARQLEAAGVPRETARIQAKGVSGFVNLAQRAGFDPADVLASYGIEIGRVDRQAQQVGTDGQAQAPVDATEDVPGLSALEAELGDATIEQLDEAGRTRNNASGESAASAEALNRQESMRTRGETFVVYDRAGRRRVLLGPDAVDYNPQAGETYGVDTPVGFRTLTDNGGRVPADHRSSAILGDALGRILGQPRAVPAVRAGIRIEGEKGPVNAKGERAFFVGYQPPFRKGGAAMALYNIEGGENDGSTVDADMLRKFGIHVPETPALLEFNQRALAATPALRDWFGNSVVRESDGNPQVVYHGTTRTFTTFDNERANPEADFGRGFYFSNNPLDTNENYAAIGPDLRNRIDTLVENMASNYFYDEDIKAAIDKERGITGDAETEPERTISVEDAAKQIVMREHVEHLGLTMPVFLKIENPAVLGGENETALTIEIETDEQGDIVREGGTLLRFVEAVREAAEGYHDTDIESALQKVVELAIGDEQVGISKVLDVLKHDEAFGYATDDDGRLVSNEIIRDALERTGFDGIIDHTVNEKFGDARKIGKPMEGVDQDTVHYIAFKPTQVKSAIGNRGTYDAFSPNILFQQDQMELWPWQEVYYSRLERAVESIKQNKGPGKQWKAAIKNAKTGINRDEMAITRLEDLDDEQTYTKDEVLAYVKLNRPSAAIVNLGGDLRTVRGEADTDLQEQEPEGPTEEEIDERTDEIYSRMVDEAEQNLDLDDIIGSPTYVEDEIEDEIEEEVEVPETDAEGNEVLDADGEPVMTTEYQTRTETRTVYRAALEGGYRAVRRRNANGYTYTTLERRRGEEIIDDIDEYFDTWRDARDAAREHVDDVDREPFYERMRELAEEEVDRDDARREAEEELGVAREDDEPAGGSGVRYQGYELEPAPLPGTYREVFIVSPSPIKKFGPTPEAASQALFRGQAMRRALREPLTRKERQEQIKKYVEEHTSKEQQGVFSWRDGHSNYRDIKNPIVRLRLDERESIGEKLEAGPPPAMTEEHAAQIQAATAAKEQFEELRKSVIARLEADTANWGPGYRFYDGEVLNADTPFRVLRYMLTDEEENKYYKIREDIRIGEHAEEAHKALVEASQVTRYAPGERWLFIEEIQPPRPEEQGNMPPIFLANWREIALKWALREAAERGLAGIAWTTGRQQVERYSSIEEQVRHITWEPETDTGQYGAYQTHNVRRKVGVALNSGGFVTFGVDERGVIKSIAGHVHESDQFMDQPLGAVFPDEITEKILDPATETGKLEGRALKIGGKGLASVYDKDLPNTIHDIAPVKELGLRTTTVPMRVNAKFEREIYSKTKTDAAGNEHSVEAARVTRGDQILADFETTNEKSAYDQASEWIYAHSRQNVDQQPALRITPELGEKVRKGLALFQAARYRPVSAAELDLLNDQAQAVAQKAVQDNAGAQVAVHMTTGGELFIDNFNAPPAAMQALTQWADEHNIQVAAGDAVPADATSFFDFVRNGEQFYDPSSFGTWVRKAKNDTATTRREQAAQMPRARIQFFPGRTSITLFETADRTSFLHEIGHLYLEMMGDLVERLSAMPIESLNAKQVQLKADYRTILAHLGVGDRAELTVKELELFARSFETYLMEGKAPSLRLREAFARFRVWFKQIYKSLLALNAPLTDDVRKVFDRMLATDDEIEQQAIESRMVPMFTTPEQARMSPEGFALYRQAVEEASRQAQEELDQRLQAEVLREETAAWRARRAEVKQQVTQQTHAMPVYRALAAMRKGTNPDGSAITAGVTPAPMKLSKKLVEEQFGAERMKKLPKGILSAEGGVEPQVIADLFGFESGDDLLNTLSGMVPMAQRIKAEVQKKMLQEFGSMLVDGSVQGAARTALTTEGRELVLREELKALAKLQRSVQPFEQRSAREERKERDYERRWFEAEAKLRIAIAEGYKQAEIDRLEAEVRKFKAQARIGPSKIRGALPNAKVLRAQSVEIVAKTKVRELRPLPFFFAAKQASMKATEAAARQDFDTAITEKQREIVMLSLYRETVAAQEDTTKRIRDAQRLGTNKGMKSLAQLGDTYRDQVVALLDRFGLAKAPQEWLDRRPALDRFLKGIEADGRPVPQDLPEIVTNEARRVKYQELSAAELIEVSDAIKEIVHLGRDKQKLLKAEQKATLDQVASEAETSIRESKKKRAEPPGDRRASEERKRDIRGYFSAHRKLSNLLQEMDGWQSGGVMWRTIMKTLNDAANKEAEMNADATQRFGEIVERAYPKGEKRTLYTRAFVPAIGKSLSKMERLMVALNWGNEGNRDRVMRGRGWSQQQVEAILDTLDERDWQFVQNTWDFFESYWPQIAAKQQRVFGIRPAKVQAAEVTTKFGTLRGGYFPLKYDDRISASAADKLDLDAANLAKQAAYAHVTTQRGHTEARAASHNEPIRLDFGVMFEHVQQVVHDLSHHEALIDVQRILSHRKVVSAIKEHYGDQVYKEIKNSVRDIAFGDLPATDGFERAFNHVRKGSTVVGLGWNLTTSALQFLGFFNTAAELGAWWTGRGIASLIGQPWRMNAVVDQIYAESSFMKTRGLTQQRELNEIRNSVGTYSGQFSAWVEDALSTATADIVTKQGISDSYFYFIQKMQQMVDVPTYLGAKAKALAEGHDEATAIALAEQAVLDTQGGGQVKDLASVQRGGPMKKLFTNFYSYFNVVYNQAVKIAGRTSISNPASLGRAAVDYMMLFIMPATLSYLVKEWMKPGDGDDKDKDLWLALIRENLSYMMGMLVGLREFSSTVQGYYGYEGPAGARFFADGAKLIRQVSQGELDEALLKSLNQVGGSVFHYPATQAWKTLNGLAAIIEGDTQSPLVLVTGPEKK